MHQPRKWWIGLPILAGLVYFAAANLTPRIEADLQSRAASLLARTPESGGSPQISVSGRDVTISGVSLAAGALDDLRMAPGLRKLAASASTVVAIAKPVDSESPPPRDAPGGNPYAFSAAIGEGMITLSGQLPSEELRKTVVAQIAALGAGAAVSDATRIDAAAPTGDYAAAVGFALEALGRLSQGRVAIAGGKVSVEGQGRENVRAETIEAEAKARLPQGFELARADVVAGPVSPYVFGATREGAEATLTGFAPDEGARKRIVEAARRRFFGATVADRLSIATGAPPNFIEAVDASLAALSRLAEGRLSIRGANVTLTGAAHYDEARAEVEAAFAAALPKSFRNDGCLGARAAGSPLDAAACRTALTDLARTPIIFETDDSAVAADSAPLVDALTATVLRCRAATIEVAAHTDNFGIEEINRSRTKRRAQVLVDRLIKAGADPSRVSAAGYGSERPVAPNDSDENRARNRRVEFVVR